MNKKKLVSVLMLVCFLCTISFTTTSALGSYENVNGQKINPSSIQSKEICSVAGVGLIVGTVGVGVAIVQGAYAFGTYIGSLVGSNQLQTVAAISDYEKSTYNPTDFSEFDN